LTAVSKPVPSALRLARTGEVLDLLRRGAAETTADLSTTMGVARSTVTERLDVLLRHGLVVNVGETSGARGRPASRLAFNKSAGVTLAAARSKVIEAVGPSSRANPNRRTGSLPKTARAARALARSVRFAHARGSEVVTSARRSGIVKSTPRIPPATQMSDDVQNGKPDHQPTMTRPGSTKMMADRVPAADATVWTMLFSRIDESRTMLSNAIEMTAAGIDEAKVSPTLRPR